MSGIGNDSPFTPRTPPTSPQLGRESGEAPANKTSIPQGQKPAVQDTVGKPPTQSSQEQEQAVEQELVTEVASLNPESIVEEELQESDSAESEDLKEMTEGKTQEGQTKNAEGTRRSPVNIGKMTMNEDGQQTDAPDDSIGHLAHTLMDGNPESLCEAADVAANIISEDEDEDDSEQQEQEDDEDEQ